MQSDQSARASDELSLVERSISGDRDAQRDLFHQHRRHVHATLYRVLGSNHEIDDLVQEAFLEIFRSLSSFRGESSLGTWLDRVTSRVAFRYLSRKRPETARLSLVPEIPAGDASAEERVITREAARRLYAVLDRLEPRQRIAFTLHVIDGRPLREVAKITESSLVATKTRVWRASREVEARAKRDPMLAAFLAMDTSDRGTK